MTLNGRWLLVPALLGLSIVAGLTAAPSSPWWWVLATALLVLAGTAHWDLMQSRHAVLRNYPLLGHLRYAMEALRPELQQYFIERDYDGRPFNRETRSIVYERAKGTKDQDPFGTELNVYGSGAEHFVHSMAPVPAPDTAPRVRVGDNSQAYDMALLNVSAMSFGSLSAEAILALNRGAAEGGFAHDTGEGGMSDYHLRHGGDLVWELGTGYFGCRTPNGDFDPDEFANKAAHPSVRCISLKLSQGAKPGLGGVLPASKVTAEIARARDVPQGQTVVSPSYHPAFQTPRELVQFLKRLRELAGGKPTGFKLCVGSRREMLAVCAAMRAEDFTPDFIVVDGSEGGTGAAPLEFVDHLGTPLTEGLHIVHTALVGTGLRDRVALGASGKVATGADLVKRLVHGADYTNAARPMMLALGCIQAQRCHTNTCPVGVATQDPARARALDVDDKAVRVQRFQRETVASATQIMASIGVTEPSQLRGDMLRTRLDPHTVRSHAELYPGLERGQLLHDATPGAWQHDWHEADPDRFP